MSPREFYFAMMEYSEMQMDKVKVDSSLMRLQTTLILNPFLGKNQIKDPKKLITFSWEEPPKQSVEQMKEFMMGIVASSKGKVKTNKT